MAIFSDDPISSEWHSERIEAVVDVLRQNNAKSIIDLGCGTGTLLLRLSQQAFVSKLVGVDISMPALADAEQRFKVAAIAREKWPLLINGSFTKRYPELKNFDAAVMIETIEHIEPNLVSGVEQTIFGYYRPDLVLITTPNRDYNATFGNPHNKLRHPEHCFEWSRDKFQNWASGVATRRNYCVDFAGLGPYHSQLGHPTQIATFKVLS